VRRKIRVKDFADYEKKLRSNGVIVRAAARKEKVEKELGALARKGSYKVHEDAELLKLVSYLNEYPTVIEGKFGPGVFVIARRDFELQSCAGTKSNFAVEKRGGELAPNFLAVINLDKDPKGLTRIGHEKGPASAFCPMRGFSWESDQKCRLADYLPKLERVTYESRLGSYRDRSNECARLLGGFRTNGSTSVWRKHT